MTHDKRLPAPRHYPIDRKQVKYVTTIKGSRSREDAVPVSVLLRDVLGYAENEKEAKKIVQEGKVLRNGEQVGDIQQGVGILDAVEIEEVEEDFRVFREGNRLELAPVNDVEPLGKITGKSSRGDKFVYRLHNGENHLSGKEFETGNTLMRDKDQEIELAEGAKVLAIKGRHAGEVGELVEVEERGLDHDSATVEAEDEFETRLENLVAVEGIDLGGIDG